MSNHKYIILLVDGMEIVKTFPDYQEHAWTAHQYPNTTVVAAGFFVLDMSPMGTVTCDAYGESRSLNGIKSRPNDGDLILRHLGYN